VGKSSHNYIQVKDNLGGNKEDRIKKIKKHGKLHASISVRKCKKNQKERVETGCKEACRDLYYSIGLSSQFVRAPNF
jgi:hypothetical protein